MAEITLDDTKICIPTRLKISTFLSELQKKTKQILYLINDKEIGVFQSLNDVKRGMWRRLKPNDSIAHYYIDPETQNEYTVFSTECATKLGNFPYEGPITNQLSSQDRSAYQQSLQSMRPPVRSSVQSSSLQQPIPSLHPFQQTQTTTLQSTGQAQGSVQGSVQGPVQGPAFQGAVQGQSYGQSQQLMMSSYPPYGNFGYQKYPVEQRQPPPSEPSQPKMNSKSIENMNRIMAFQRQQMAPPPSEQPMVNQWFNSYDHQVQPHPQQPLEHTYPTFQNHFTYPQQQVYPQQGQGQQVTQNLGQQNLAPQNLGSVQGTMQGSVQGTMQGTMQGSVQGAQPQNLFPQFPPSVNRQETSVMNKSVMSAKSYSKPEDPFKYFPPGSRKKPETGAQKLVQNVTPQIVESKFSA
jgi:hypothetical protein